MQNSLWNYRAKVYFIFALSFSWHGLASHSDPTLADSDFAMSLLKPGSMSWFVLVFFPFVNKGSFINVSCCLVVVKVWSFLVLFQHLRRLSIKSSWG